MIRLTERRRWILTGVITLSLLAALVVLGVSIAFGALDGGYQLVGRFDAAGQGLVAGNDGSDVQIRGVDVGHVADIELVDGAAVVTVTMDEGQRVPRDTLAVIRPKTLFGEKFVDLELEPEAERDGPFLQPGDEFTDTLGGFELERVLADAYPILEAIDPADLGVVLGELADAGRGLGPVINRSIVNFATLTRLQVEHDDDIRQFLRDLALLSDELGDRADDLVAGAEDLNVALPPLNERADELNVLLREAARLSGGVADVLENNRGFLRKNVTEGGKALQVLSDERANIQPLVTGLRQYVQTLAEVIGLPLGDGTK
ncbi:MAG: MCE family protein, partial [Actinomycetota bacterium]